MDHEILNGNSGSIKRTGSSTYSRKHKRFVSTYDSKNNKSFCWNDLLKKYSNEFTQTESKSFNLLVKLLTVTTMYKKSTPDHSSKSRRFDISKSTEYPPDRCGYELRYISINPDFNHITIRQNKEGKAYYEIEIENIKKPVISQRIIEIIKEKKRLENEGRELKEMIFGKEINCSIELEDNYYPFYFEMTEGNKLDLIAKEYETLKTWVMGINEIITNRTIIEKFRRLIDENINMISY